MRPFLLITNDDGIQAPGIKHLWQAVSEFADVAIVAPLFEKSGSGISITWAKPLQVLPYSWEGGATSAWSVNGTPADCVKMACSVILEKQPQMILSGVNRGSNAGRTVLYSGTVGGVIEGIYKNIPGIAFSFSDFDAPPLSATKGYIVSLVKHFLKHPLPQGTFLNVTFPCDSKNGTAGFRLAKQGRGYWVEAPERRIHPEGLPYYWLGAGWAAFDEDPESDIALLKRGYITGVPIRVNELTDLVAMEQQKALIDSAFHSEVDHSLERTRTASS